PSGGRGSFAYYSREGDHMGLHLDVDSCDVVVLTLLYDNSDPDDLAGAMVLYPDFIGKPLSTVRAHPNIGILPLKPTQGQTLVMFGGLVPHFVAPVRRGQVRVMSVLCFKASNSS